MKFRQAKTRENAPPYNCVACARRRLESRDEGTTFTFTNGSACGWRCAAGMDEPFFVRLQAATSRSRTTKLCGHISCAIVSSRAVAQTIVIATRPTVSKGYTSSLPARGRPSSSSEGSANTSSAHDMNFSDSDAEGCAREMITSIDTTNALRFSLTRWRVGARVS